MLRARVVACPSEIVRSPSAAVNTAPRSIWRQASGLLFFSAIRGNDPPTREWSDDTETQARQALDNLRALLEANGATLHDPRARVA
ncbi:MAG TPA: RidA family protein [Chloroflexota bacterium]|jgi:enamine deaminase RidA (YjgF/YER057c/UK114 family)